MEDFSRYSMSSLTKEADKLSNAVMELRFTDPTANAEKIKFFVDQRAVIEDEIKKREDAEAERKLSAGFSSAPKSRDEAGALGKDMRCAIERIPTFDASGEASEFLENLKNCFLNYVKGTPSLEGRFVKAAITRLSTSYQTQINNSSKTITSYDELKEYIELNWSSQLTVYQKISEMFDIDAEHGNWTAYASQLQNKSSSVLRFIEDAWARENSDKGTVTAKKLMELWSVMIFLDKLRGGKDESAYTYIVGTLDKVWDLPAVVAKAKGYLDRTKGDESGVSGGFFGSNRARKAQRNQSNGQTGGQQKSQPKAKNDQKADSSAKKEMSEKLKTFIEKHPGVCYGWANGKCKIEEKGKQCRWKHSYDGESSSNQALFGEPIFQN